jgi:uncharacterized protein YcgI (DUF1989 family)
MGRNLTVREYIVPGKSGMHFELAADSTVKIIDAEGQQVVDFFAVSKQTPDEILSTGVTIDCNESLRLERYAYLYSNQYSRMFQITDDSVKTHDLLHPCCRPEMYEYFYKNGANHPNCHENINNQLKKLGISPLIEIHPFNIFMNTKIWENGKIEVLEPKSKANDFIELKALISVDVFLAACSVSESACNAGRCTPVKAVVKGQ